MQIKKTQNQDIKIANIAVLLIIPIILLILSRVLVHIKGPYYMGWNLDPEYAYLFNSVNLLHLDVPGHYDHPGTTVQELGGLVILARFVMLRIFAATPSMHLDVITNPEAYLNWINVFLNLLIGGSLFLLGRTLFKHTGKLWLGVISQTAPFIFSASCLATTRVTPEPLLIVVGILISSLIINEYCKEGSFFTSWRSNILLGILLGFGAATKVTLLPLFILLLISKNIRRMVVGAGSAGISFIFFTLPILPRYSRFVSWLKNLLTHDGIYGGGQARLPGMEKLIQNLWVLISSEAQYFLWVIILLGILIAFRKAAKERRTLWILLLLFIVMITQAAVTVKHPPAHYMIPSMSLMCLLPVLWMRIFSKNPWQARAVMISIFGLSILSMVFVSYKEIQRIIVYNQSVEQVDQLIESKYSNCAVADRYRSSGLEFALSFGNDYSEFHNQVSLLNTYPSAISYEKWGNYFHSFGQQFSAEEIQTRLENGGCLLMRGSPMDEVWLEQLPVEVIRVDEGQLEALYLVVHVK